MSESSSWLSPRLLLVSMTLALLAAIGTYVVLDGGDDEPATSSDGSISLTPSEGPVAADPVFKTYEGEEVAMSTLAGRPLLVNFFASTCVPCVTEMPAFEEVYQEVGEEVAFLGLAVADRTDDARSLVERTGVTYPTALDQQGEVIDALGGTMLPTTVLLDADGETITSHSGALDADELRQLLDEHLQLAS